MPRKPKSEMKTVAPRLPEYLESDTVAITRDLAKALINTDGINKWTAVQKKLFAILLMNIKWKDDVPSGIVQIKNEEAWNLLGRGGGKTASDKGVYLRQEFKKMKDNSEISLADPYSNHVFSGNLILKVLGSSTYTEILLNPTFLPHFGRLYSTKSFITMIGTDLTSFASSYSFPFYIHLRLYCNTSARISTRSLTTKALKEVFGLGQYDYMIKSVKTTPSGIPYNLIDAEDNKFDRVTFEKQILNRVIEEINRSEMIRILPWDDGKFYYKEKQNGKVIAYRFKYIVLNEDTIRKRREKRAGEAVSEDMDKLLNEIFDFNVGESEFTDTVVI